MKSLRLATLAAALMVAYAPVASAQEKPEIAVVNIQQIMQDSSAAKSVRDQLESKQKAFQAEITKKEEALQKEDQELGKQRNALSKEAYEEKVRAFRNKATDVQKEVQTKKAMLDGAFERALNEIQKVVTEIIVELSKEKGFNTAIPTSQLLYADPKLDVTSEVLSRLNQKLSKIDVKFENSDGKK